MWVKSNVYDSPQIWNDNLPWCDARLQSNIHDIVDKTSGQGLRHCTFLWILHTIGLNADTFGTTMLLIWQILTDYPGRTKMSGRVFGSRVNIYLCLIHRASSSCWGSGLQLTPMRVSKEYQKTRSKCLFILIPFYSLPKYKDLWTLQPRVCPCMRCDAGDVIVVMSVSWSVPGLGSLNKVMRSKLNSAMSVPVWAMSRATAHTKTVLLQYLSKSKCFQNRHSAWCIWLWNWMKWLKCKRKSGTFIWLKMPISLLHYKQATAMQQALCWFPIRLLWPLESEVCSTLQHHTSPAFNRWRQGGALSALSTAWRSRICRQSVVCKMQIVAACWCSLQIMGRQVSPKEREVLRRRTSVTALVSPGQPIRGRDEESLTNERPGCVTLTNERPDGVTLTHEQSRGGISGQLMGHDMTLHLDCRWPNTKQEPHQPHQSHQSQLINSIRIL